MSDEDAADAKRFAFDHVRMMIDSGCYSKKQVFDCIAQEVAGNAALAPEGPKLRGYAAKRWSAREAEERTWTEQSMNDALDAAFAALNQAGIVALQNAGWTNTTGWEECWDLYNERKEAGATPRGAVFYHTQDLERGVRGEGLMLGFGVFHEDNDGDLEGNARLGQEVCQVLAAHGVATVWAGDAKTRIQIPPFPWRKRTSTSTPAVRGAPGRVAPQLREVPWLCLRHPDGRGWQIRQVDAVVELRITLAPGEEPILRRRSHADAAQAAQAAADLIREQREDGFVAG